MSNFWALAGFEFKKLFGRRMALAAAAIALGSLAVFAFSSLNGESWWHRAGGGITQYEAMLQDKATIQENKGEITPQLAAAAVAANSEMTADADNYLENEYGRHLKSEAYIKYTLPYEAVVDLINVIYQSDSDLLSTSGYDLVSVGKAMPIDGITPGAVANFDEDLRRFMLDMVNQRDGLSEKEIAADTALIEKISLPLKNDWYGGYEAFINGSKGLALAALFLILILLAPLFAAEYEDKTDSLILCSKNGRGSLCVAKLCVALAVSLGSCALIIGGGLLLALLIYGFEGGGVNIQVMNASCPYPLSMAQACGIYMACAAAASVLLGAFIALLSAAVRRKTFTVIAVGTAATLLPMFIWTPLKSSRVLYDALHIFPVNAVTFGYGFDMHFIDIFGRLLAPYKAITAISIILAIIFLAAAAHTFKNHAIN